MHSWPHAPPHRTLEKGTYMVTAATYQKVMHFNSPDRLQFLHDSLLEIAEKYQWKLQAWAVLGNHYHFIAQSSEHPENLSAFISNLHIETAKYINKQDNQLNRQVWWQFWDSCITYQYSYLARLNYVNHNPVKHGLVKEASQYPWCSARWFEENHPSSFSKTVRNFKIDRVNVIDDF